MSACPNCDSELLLRRIDDLHVVEYRARCQGCGWTGWLWELRCGGCHGPKFFEWTNTGWRCLRCGHVRRDQSPPRDYKPGGPGGP